MNKRVLIPFVALAALMLIVGLACGSTDDTTTTDNGGAQVQPTAIIVQPTLPPPPTATESAPAYFTEEFDVDFLDNWSYFLTYGNEDAVSIQSGNGKLTVDIQDTDTAVYLMYDPYVYTDVRMDARVTNRGQNTNNISFICRYNGTDWFEYSISNGGMWVLYYGKWDDSGITASYGELAQGGADHIFSGKHTNEFTVTCEGNEFNIYVNGHEEGSYIDHTYMLGEGQVGINVTSFYTYPITLDFDYFTVSQP